MTVVLAEWHENSCLVHAREYLYLLVFLQTNLFVSLFVLGITLRYFCAACPPASANLLYVKYDISQMATSF